MLSTLLTTLPPVVHIISTELEIPLTAVTVQSSFSGSPLLYFQMFHFQVSHYQIICIALLLDTLYNLDILLLTTGFQGWRIG